jgi:stage V sporulation protein D (sporulation-specific penicillin-binding protein)
MAGMQAGPAPRPQKAVRRVRLFFVLAVMALGIFWVRSFYLQVIKHDYYRQAAQSDQLKEYQIAAQRGIIQAHNGDDMVPIVLNQKLYTLYADPTMVKDTGRAAETLTATLGGNASDYEKKLKASKTRYVVLAKKLSAEQKNAVLKHKYPGIGAQEISYRTYPNGTLAAQLLGFVNDEGKGVYGIEQALNGQLSGKPGLLKAVTDVHGIPLAANSDNIQIAPKKGDSLVLTIDVAMQKQLEGILEQGLKNAKSESGSALIMDPNTGAIKAMANWPTYDPNKYTEVEDPNVFNNPAVSSPLEVGSIMKPFTTAAALDLGAIKSDTSYDDPSFWVVDGYKITNIEEDGGPGRHNMAALLNLSLNTGATWLLMQMSKAGGTDITPAGREHWHDYMVNHFLLGKPTGIEQGYEADGTIPDPNNGYARDLTYANTSFGQGMTATPIQMAAAFSAIVNGGTYYQPRLVDQYISNDGKVTNVKPKILKANAVSSKVSEEMRPLLEYVVANHAIRPPFDHTLYGVGGKTGTAQIADPHGAGGYKEHDFNGTYLGFVGGDMPQYVVMVRVNEPKIGGYAGGAAAQPIFGTVGHMLIDNFGVTPKSR